MKNKSLKINKLSYSHFTKTQCKLSANCNIGLENTL